jgi:hypothetical protein
MSDTVSDADIIVATRQWVERAVIGLKLCPFAEKPHVNGQVRYVVSRADTPEALLGDLMRELEVLAEAPSAKIETTLLIHPFVLADFLDYNDFLGVVDDALEDMELDGILQVASLHPRYRFADTEPDDIENYTNRAPYPTLHLLREASVVQGLASYPEADHIMEKNIATLRRLGHEGWKALGLTAPQAGKK